ncbi:uncharacterized protein LOC143225369 [Tachypleus tridentatus]|uniref:uncharacterized protein LOC143225369 n=1 Tax=Tachypleus tridentatus TaxID=6853 RepID=UPI003FD69443
MWSFIFFLMVADAHVQRRATDSCNLEKFDQCGAVIMDYTDDPRVIFTNEEEIKQHCEKQYEAQKCLQKYTEDCLEGTSKEAMEILTSSLENGINKRCTNDGELRADFLEHGPCLRKIFKDRYLCLTRLITRMYDIQNGGVPQELSVMSACCAWLDFGNCSRNLTETSCGEKAANLIRRKAEVYTQEMFDFICKDLSPETCQNMKKPKFLISPFCTIRKYFK